MDHLRQGIHLRGYGAKNPKQECKREAFELFSQMLVEISSTVGGLWEFLGGKVEAGEAVTDDLCRELDEGLGMQPLSWESLICMEHTYPEKTFLPNVWNVKDLHGEAHGREGQAVGWVAPHMLDQFEFPEANHGIIEALDIQKMYSGNIVIHPTF